MPILFLLVIFPCFLRFGQTVPQLAPEAENAQTKILSDLFNNDKPNYEVFYKLYTQNTKNEIQRIDTVSQLEYSTFDPKKLSMFIVHGWRQSSSSSFNFAIKDAVLDNHDINVFVTDWSSASKNLYGVARDTVKPVGKIIGNFINEIQDTFKLNGSSFLLVGHSLGSHIAGCAGAVVKNKVDRIVGLDPAGPEFENRPYNDDVLKSTDAEYVEVIHTGGGLLGLYEPIGHVDYYPNGGMRQRGCPSLISGSCNHRRSHEYFAESLKNGPVFEAVLCNNIFEFLSGQCDNNTRSVMGQITKEERAFGKYFLTTNSEPPFAQGKNVKHELSNQLDILLEIIKFLFDDLKRSAVQGSTQMVKDMRDFLNKTIQLYYAVKNNDLETAKQIVHEIIDMPNYVL